MGVDVSSAVAGLDLIKDLVTAATADITHDAAERFKLAEDWNIKPGTPGNTTNAPGDLAASVMVEGPVGGDGVYESRVGPTLVYSWQREAGGDIFPKRVAALHFFRFGEEIFTKHVWQEGSLYRERSYAEMLPSLEPMAVERIAEAIAGGGG